MTSKRSPARVYLLVWLALSALTLLSFALSRLALGPADAVLTLLIAVLKSSLVGLFFMHLLEERLRAAFVPIITMGFVLLLVSLVVTDVLTRHTFPRAVLPLSTPDELSPPPPGGPSR